VAEIEELKKEAAAFRDVRKGLSQEDGAKKTFEKVRLEKGMENLTSLF
jgi:hypothetical protein